MSDKDSNNTSGTNWEKLEAMEDETIDYTDIPPLTEEFFEKATLRIPTTQAQRLVSIDPDILKWFQAHSREYRDSINSVLRDYVETRENNGEQPVF
jgi:uncharacterized protein (DUF4415 family)